MTKRVTGTAIAVMFFSMLAGCVERPTTIIADTGPSDDNQTQAQLEETVEDPILTYRWPLSNSTLIAPPIEVQKEAIATCRSLGNDTGYMISISIEETEAIGVFGCRGAD